MEQEKETKLQAECSRELAQRIMRELTPAGVQVWAAAVYWKQRWKRPASA